jgi:hypothetical protein
MAAPGVPLVGTEEHLTVEVIISSWKVDYSTHCTERFNGPITHTQYLYHSLAHITQDYWLNKFRGESLPALHMHYEEISDFEYFSLPHMHQGTYIQVAFQYCAFLSVKKTAQ